MCFRGTWHQGSAMDPSQKPSKHSHPKIRAFSWHMQALRGVFETLSMSPLCSPDRNLSAIGSASTLQLTINRRLHSPNLSPAHMVAEQGPTPASHASDSLPCSSHAIRLNRLLQTAQRRRPTLGADVHSMNVVRKDGMIKFHVGLQQATSSRGSLAALA